MNVAIFAAVCSYQLPEGLQDLLFLSLCWHWLLAKPDAHSRAGKQQNAGVWPERQGLVLEHYSATWLHRLVKMPQLGDKHVVCTLLCCLL